MHDFPSRVLWLHDSMGVRFGCLRIAPRDPEGKRWDCIFDVQPSDQQATRPEVRWLQKRNFKRYSEHRIQQDEDGVLTVSQAAFKLTLTPTEHGLATTPPAPPISAQWDEPAP